MDPMDPMDPHPMDPVGWLLTVMFGWHRSALQPPSRSWGEASRTASFFISLYDALRTLNRRI